MLLAKTKYICINKFGEKKGKIYEGKWLYMYIAMAAMIWLVQKRYVSTCIINLKTAM